MNNEHVTAEPVNSGRSIGSLFSVLLFFLFTLCMVMVMVVGATVYNNIVKRMDDNFNDRTAIAYITNKIRQYDMDDMVSVINIEGQNILELREVYDDIVYHTLIYSSDGEIRELFKAEEDELPLSDGISIIEAKNADFVLANNGLISILIEGAKGIQQTYVKLRSSDHYE